MHTPTNGRNTMPPTNDTTIPIMTQNASRISSRIARMRSTIPTAMKPFSTSRERRSL